MDNQFRKFSDLQSVKPKIQEPGKQRAVREPGNRRHAPDEAQTRVRNKSRGRC